MTILVIVESPAKCKKIESYLGSRYKCIASFGHLRTITGLDCIDIQNGFQTKYSIIDEPLKKKQVEKLRQEIAKSDEVILATDDDREGEAIAWHICQLFDLSVDNTQRILFHEITENALQHAVLNPTKINMNIVNAQLARQIIDMLVGYNISPVLWRLKTDSKINKSSLSAGRCQTPCLRLIYDNYLDIKNAPGKLVYNTTGYFTNLSLNFELNRQFTNENELTSFYNECKTSQFICNVSNPKKTIKKQPEPLTTSNLQQLASNELHLSPKETMKYAQELYEGGYITYMRTDSKKYSDDFVSSIKSFIYTKYGEQYFNQPLSPKAGDKDGEMESDRKENKGKKDKKQILVQEAHEAIRPVNVSKEHIEIDGEITGKAIRLYDLIWNRTMESCMASAQFNTITAKINVYDTVDFVYKTEQVIFPGWLLVQKKNNVENEEYNYLVHLKKNIQMLPKKITSAFTVVELKTHYSEANLIKTLEDKGIGRPSTFASLVDKIQERKYVEKQNIKGVEMDGYNYVYEHSNGTVEKQPTKKTIGTENGKLVITSLGVIVIEFLLQHFSEFFDYDYTKEMESELDLVAKGTKMWNLLCNDCHKHLLVYLKDDFKKFEIEIDDEHKIIIGAHGPVIKYTDKKNEKNVKFISLKKGLDFKSILPRSVALEDIIDEADIHVNSIGKYKGVDLFIKTGKYGIYAQWGSNKRSLNELDKPVDKISYTDAILFLDKDNLLDPKKPVGLLRELTKNLSIREGKVGKGDYIFYKKPHARKAEFYKLEGFTHDYKKCDKELLINWIEQTYRITV